MNLVKRLLVTSLLTISACSIPKGRPSYNSTHEKDSYSKLRNSSQENFIYKIIPRYAEDIPPWDLFHWTTWMLFGNQNNGIFGEDQEKPYSEDIGLGSFLAWQLRNPLHNFTFYGIGSAGWEKHTTTEAYSLDNKKGSHSKLVFNDYKPFISLVFPVSKEREFQFYFGWRERGNLGIKLKPTAKKEQRR